jgi:hypothetical protein
MKESDDSMDLDSSISDYTSAMENEEEHNEVVMQLDAAKEETVGFFFFLVIPFINTDLMPPERRKYGVSLNRAISRNRYFCCDPHTVPRSCITAHFEGDNAHQIILSNTKGKEGIAEFLEATSHW